VGCLELGLRLVGYGYATSFFLQTTINGQAYFVPNDKFGCRFFPSALARTAAPQRMAVKKASNTFRIFVFGESAAMGDPEPSYGAWRYLQTLLRERFPGTDFEVICVAMTAINSHAILPIARECARLDGDLWIVYMGNNELVGPLGAGSSQDAPTPGTGLVRAELAIKNARLGQLLDGLMQRWSGHSARPKTWGGLNMFEHHQLLYDDPNRLRAYENFKRNLTDILDAGQASAVPVLLSTVGSNLKDCAPFASLHAPNLNETQRVKWDETYQRGVALESAGEYQNALGQFTEAVAIDPQYAELQFRLGCCHRSLANPAQAAAEFVLARDYDALAFRADTRINQIINEAAKAKAGKGVYLLNAGQILDQNSPDNIAGNELFYEHVHLNFAGNYLLGRAFAEQAAKLLPATVVAHGQSGWATADLCDRRLAVSAWDRSRVYQEIINRLAEPVYAQQLTHDATVHFCGEQIEGLNFQTESEPLDQTCRLYEQALALAPTDNFLHQNFATFLAAHRKLAQATIEAQHVCELLPQRPAQYYDIGNLLLIQGRIDDAADYYSHALTIQPDFVNALNGKGLILANGQKTPEAVACFKRALRADPNNPDTYLNLGFLEQIQGDFKPAAACYQKAARLQPQGPADYFNQAFDSSAHVLPARAVESFGKAIELKPTFWQARYLLGLELASQGNSEEARTQFLQAAQYRPDFVPAHLNLGMMCAKLEEPDQALAEFRITLQLDPSNSLAQQYVESHQKRPARGPGSDLK